MAAGSLADECCRGESAALVEHALLDDLVELGRLLDGEIGGFGAFQNPVDINCSSAKKLGDAWSVRYEPPGDHVLLLLIHRRQPPFRREGHDLLYMKLMQGVGGHDERVGALRRERSERAFELVRTAHL